VPRSKYKFDHSGSAARSTTLCASRPEYPILSNYQRSRL